MKYIAIIMLVFGLSNDEWMLKPALGPFDLF